MLVRGVHSEIGYGNMYSLPVRVHSLLNLGILSQGLTEDGQEIFVMNDWLTTSCLRIARGAFAGLHSIADPN